MPEYARMAFVLHVSIVIPCLVERVVTYLEDVPSFKEHEAIFLKRQNLIAEVFHSFLF